MSDFLFREDLAALDPTVNELIEREAERQARKLILIPSESYASQAVRRAQGSVFQNVYAEGYPWLRTTRDPEALLEDLSHQLVYYRRYADRRFYKGVDYVDIVEALTQRRAAAALATERTPAGHIFANIQALSGAAANLAVYEALLQPGDTLMGMNLFQGGHLTHGSEFNFSGRRYRVVSYGVDPKTERLDYDDIMALAREYRPRIIVAGYTSYSWAPDWEKFRAIADEVGAYLMADIAHVAGMVMAGAYPNPIDHAHVVVFTTHKTLCGPRGAVILTANEEVAQQIDMAVFPGAQGGPHVNKFAAIAVALEMSRTGQFKRLQHQIVANAKALADGLVKRGLKLAYGGTDTHLLLLDLKSVPVDTGYPLYGEPVARILDLAGIVVNKNTIPGDELTVLATGIRMGTPWVTQRGLDEADMDTLAGIIHDVVTAIKPFTYAGIVNPLPRGKIDLEILEEARCGVAALADKAGIDFEVSKSDYPHFFISQRTPELVRGQPPQQACPEQSRRVEDSLLVGLRVGGWRAKSFLQGALSANIAALQPGDGAVRAFMLDKHGRLIDDVLVSREPPDEWGRDRYLLAVHGSRAEKVKAWLRGLADGYTLFDEADILRKVEGPATVEDVPEVDVAQETWFRRFGRSRSAFAYEETRFLADGAPALELFQAHPDAFDLTKPYFVGQSFLDEVALSSIPASDKVEWSWSEPEAPPKRTPLYEEHKKLGGKIIPFAGWEMPVWYSSVSEEHAAVRQAAGLFDVSHMGMFEVVGEHALSFLDVVASNYARWLDNGQSCYAYLLDPNGDVIDDFMIYRVRADWLLLVVNAANEDKDWDWLNAVNEGQVIIDKDRPWVQAEAKTTLRNLKDPAAGGRQKRDIALQGPNSIEILQVLTDDPATKEALARVRRTDLVEVELAGIPLVVARTGYTGEEIGFEIFVHPDRMVKLWNLILEKGAPFGVKPCGLAARDSTRTEAGLPLYGHELAGPFNISPSCAGFPGYVKYHKPFFVGRDVLLAKDAERTMEVARFRMNSKGVRRPNTGDPVVDRLGRFIGHVTSCALDSEGYLLGQAYVRQQANVEGTQIGIFVLPPKPRPETPKHELSGGDRVLMPIEATVLSRFPLREDQVPGMAGGGD